MVSQLTGALLRALLVMIAVVTPVVLLGQQTADARQALALLALVLGLLTFVEDKARFPSLVEFRDAAPFNRLRFALLFLTLFCLAMIERGRTAPTVLTDLMQAIGAPIGLAMDFPFSPVRLAKVMLASGLPPSSAAAVSAAIRTAAGTACLISPLSVALFVILVRMGAWPRRGLPFNVWVNLPTFDPTSGRDIVDRLTRDARVNIALGILLPFLTPAVVFIAERGFAPFDGARPLTLIWTVTPWAFLPASLFMRAIAMGRVAEMIREGRAALPSPSFSPLSGPQRPRPI